MWDKVKAFLVEWSDRITTAAAAGGVGAGTGVVLGTGEGSDWLVGLIAGVLGRLIGAVKVRL